jgi:hypothetical protein
MEQKKATEYQFEKNKVMILQKHNSKLQSLDFFLGDKRIEITNLTNTLNS